MNVEGKIALVTGAGRRLGREIALALARRGAHIAVHYHASRAEAEKTVDDVRVLGRKACAICADQAVPQEIDAAIEQTIAALGPVDILVNSAAIFERAPFPEADEESWNRHMNINLRGPYLFARGLAPSMTARGAGKIVNIVDVAAERPWPGYVPYSVSKAGLVALTKGLASALAPEIQVNGVAPGIILPPESWDQPQLDAALRKVPMRRAGTASDIADTVLFLIEGPDYITGAIIHVDGGQSAR